jgi:thioredoxin 1
MRKSVLMAAAVLFLAASALFGQTANMPKVTFIELGSVNCIPCKQMQPIMKSVEKRYGAQVKVIFYDVWKDDQQQYAKKYGVKLIPTQIFKDAKGKEIFRHEGFFPEAEIDKIMQKQGVKPLNTK